MFLGRGNPFGWRTKGFLLPKPHPFPKRALFRKIEVAGKHKYALRSQSPGTPQKRRQKNSRPQADHAAKRGCRMPSNTPPVIRQKIFAFIPRHYREKTKAPPGSMPKSNGLSSSALSGQLTAFRQAHTPATPSLMRASLQTISPRPSSPDIGGPAAKTARRITSPCQKTI